ncbi:hypothetical protein RP20_CCG000478 [Aedes albopictus]|nr:hypothetical protein RP20_CCG000478 [Aedes albopictus]
MQFLFSHHGLPCYPSAWFKENPNKKPGANLEKPCATETIDSAAHRILQATAGTGHNVSVKDIVVFLRLALEQDRVQLKDDWVSFGTTIGRAGEFVSPLSLLDITDKPCNTDGDAPTNRPVGKQNVMLAILYVTGSFALAENDRKCSSEINAKIEKYGGTWNSLTNYPRNNNCMPWNIAPLKKVFAAMDMFYFKFPEAKYSESRVGTQHLRFEGCAALVALKYVVELLDVSMERFASWVQLVPYMGSELRNLMPGSHEETDKPDSYMPYLFSIGLCGFGRAPYTIKRNQGLYELAHAIGCAYNEPRSIHAKRLKESFALGVPEMAIVICVKAAQLKNAPSPTSRSEVLERWAAIRNPRPGTIGELVKKYYESEKHLSK